MLPTTFIQISQSEIVNIDAISHLNQPQRPSRNLSQKRKFHLLFTPLPKTIKEKLELWKTNLSRCSRWCTYRPHPLYPLFTHLCTKYLCPTKSRVSIGQAMAQHQVHGALVLLYCMVIWSAIGVLFSFGGRLFSRDWSLSVPHFPISSSCWLALFH